MGDPHGEPDPFVDGLTSLASRALFMDRLGQALARRRRGQERELAVLALEVDRFDRLSERYETATTEAVLRQLASLLGEEVRAEDTVARIGDHRFGILLDGVDDAADPTHVAERVQHRLREPLQVDGRDIFASVSIGIAFGAGDTDADAVLADVLDAVEQARARGPARYRIHDRATHAHAVTVLQLETDLRLAIERNEMVVHYQPIVRPGDDRVVGLEALVRWSHPSRGLLPPQAFLPAAEETGTILDIGSLVLDTACARLRAWQDRLADPDLFVAVNISPRQAADRSLLDRVRSALAANDLPGRCLRLELAESALAGTPELATLVEGLRELGVGICIDDFGTGPTPLPALHTLRVDAVKLDRTFVRHQGARDSGLLETMAAVARGINARLLVEGIETDDQHRRVLTLEPDELQGFLFGRPVDEHAAGALLRDEAPRPSQPAGPVRTSRSPGPIPRSLK